MILLIFPSGWVRTYLLTEEHLTALFHAMIAEQAGTMDGIRDQLRIVKEELMQARQKLNNLLDAIENGLCSGEDLGQRLRERKNQVATLEVTKQHLEDKLASPLPTSLKPECLREAVQRLQAALASKDIMAKKELLRRLIQKITVTWEEPQWKVTLKYAFPAPMLLNAGNGVPDLELYGRAYGNRTRHLRLERPTS